jgi:hypothetical protein
MFFSSILTEEPPLFLFTRAKPLGPGLLRSILRDVEMTTEELIELL